MNPNEVNRFNELYQRHLRLLKLQGKSQKTIDAYSRAIRRVSEYFGCCPDQLTLEQFEIYFASSLRAIPGVRSKSIETDCNSFGNMSLKRTGNGLTL
jgi:integrase/recombinase XerD